MWNMKYRKSNWKAVTYKVFSFCKPHKNCELLGSLDKCTAPDVLLSHQTALEQQKNLCWYAAYVDGVKQERDSPYQQRVSTGFRRAHTRVTSLASTNVSHSSIKNLEEFLQCTTSWCKSGVFALAIVMGCRLVIFGQHLLSLQGVAICCCWLQARAIDGVVCCNTVAVHRAGPAPCSRHAQMEEVLGSVVIKWCASSFSLTAPRGYEYKHDYMKWDM